MRIKAPENSKIEVEYQRGDYLISIPYSGEKISKYFIAAFLLFWLGGWATGFVHALSEIIFVEIDPFTVFWLCGWTIGGVVAFIFLFQILRPSRPEQILLERDSIKYDAGVPNFSMFPTDVMHTKAMSNPLTYGMKKYEFNLEDLKSLTLKELKTGNRLVIDKDSKRIEIARLASEVEREWLYNVIKETYE